MTLTTERRRALWRSPLLLAVAGTLLAPVVVLAPVVTGASTGHAPVHVPNLIGKSRSATYSAMKAAGLYFTTSGSGSANGTWRRVLTEHPKPGTVVAWHSSVALGVTTRTGTASSTSHSATAKSGPGRVPDLRHMTRKQVFAVMRRASLYFTTSGPGSSDGTWKSVVAESPHPGTQVARLSSVKLTVSTLGPVPKGKVRVPQLVNHTKSQVYAAMKRAVLYFTTSGGGSNWDHVVSQSPAAGAVVPQRSTVRLQTAAPVVHRSTAKPTVHATSSSSNYVVGVATWYNYIPGRCATSYLPFGTKITVEDLATGVTISCVVTDRQQKAAGRVVDLSETQFSQLAPLWRGVVRVKVSW